MNCFMYYISSKNLIKSGGGNRPYETRQPVYQGAKSYRVIWKMRKELVILGLFCEEVFILIK